MQTSETTLEVNLSAISKNYALLQNKAPNSYIASAVKANSYGLGAVQISPTLYECGCRDFFVVSVDEGLALRACLPGDAKIYLLYGAFENNKHQIIESNLTPVLNHLGQVKLWDEFARSLGKALPCVIHIDTGMHRLGMPEAEVNKFATGGYDNINVQFVMSHLACSEDFTNEYNRQQLEKFKALTKNFGAVRLSFANSSGVFLGPDYHFDMIRCGAAIYGINPTPDKPNPMANVVTLRSPIIQIQNIKEGDSVGYSRRYISSGTRKIASLPLGHADGYTRYLTHTGVVYVDGHPALVVGNVSMDLVTIDVTSVPEDKLFLGQMVEVIGQNATLEKVAEARGTIAYEVLTTIGNRYKRIYRAW